MDIRAVHMAGPAPSGDFWFLLVVSKGTRRRQGIWGEVDLEFGITLFFCLHPPEASSRGRGHGVDVNGLGFRFKLTAETDRCIPDCLLLLIQDFDHVDEVAGLAGVHQHPVRTAPGFDVAGFSVDVNACGIGGPDGEEQPSRAEAAGFTLEGMHQPSAYPPPPAEGNEGKAYRTVVVAAFLCESLAEKDAVLFDQEITRPVPFNADQGLRKLTAPGNGVEFKAPAHDFFARQRAVHVDEGVQIAPPRVPEERLGSFNRERRNDVAFLHGECPCCRSRLRKGYMSGNRVRSEDISIRRTKIEHGRHRRKRRGAT